MVEAIGARLAAIQMWGWDPLCVAAGVFAGGPSPLLEQAVVGSAGEGEVVGVGGAAFGVVSVGGGRSVRACRPGYFPPPRPRTGRAAFTASGSL